MKIPDMEKVNIHKNNVRLLGKVLQRRRKKRNSPYTNESWVNYKRRIIYRIQKVKIEAHRSKGLSPEQMLLNFFDLVNSSYLLKDEAEKIDE